MPKIVQYPDSITIYQGTVSPGGKPFRSSELPALAKANKRPKGLFRYAYAMLTQVKFTPTYSGQGSVALAADAVWQLLANYMFMPKGTKRPVIENMGSLDVLQLTQQLMRYLNPDVLSSFVPVASIASSQSTHEQTVTFLLPFAPRMNDTNDPQKFLGLVPLSAFEGGTLETTPFSSDTLQADWTIGDLTIEQRLLCVDLDAAIAYQPVYMSGTTKTNQQIDVQFGLYPQRALGLMAKHQTGATDLALPSTYTVNIDGIERIAARNVADDAIENLIFRQEGFDDAIWPTALRILSPDAQGIEQMPIIRKSIILTGVFGGIAMNNCGRLLYMWCEDLPVEEQTKIMLDFEVSSSAVAKIGASRADKDLGLVIDANLLEWAA